jgi:hypothetical protein
MNTTLQLDIAAGNSTDAKRETSGQSRDRKTANGLREANVDHPLYIWILSGGRAVVSMMSLLDRYDVD